MRDVRWLTFDDMAVGPDEVGTIAGEVVEEIINEDYDGYEARNRDLAFAISFNLNYLTKMEQWRVHADADTDDVGMFYRIWVER